MDYLSGNYIDLDINQEEFTDKLKSLNKELAELENNSKLTNAELNQYKQLLGVIIKLIKDHEKEIQLLGCCCVLDMLRIIAPSEVLKSSQVKSFFNVLIKTCAFLEFADKPSYPQILHILRILVDISGCALAIKYNHSNLLLKFIECMLQYVSSNCGHTAEQLISENIRMILEELPEVSDNFIMPVLLSLSQKHKKNPRFRICSTVLQRLNSSVKSSVSSYLHQLFLITKIPKSSPIYTEKYYIGYRVYKINHDYLITVLCGITEIIKSKNSDNTIEMIGKIASCKKSSLYNSNSHLFKEFIKLYDHENEDIRLRLLGFTIKFCKNHSFNSELIEEIKKATVGRLRDSTEKVREAAILKLCNSLDYIELNHHIIEKICERLRDVKKNVRRKALEGLSKVYYDKCLSRVSFSIKDQNYTLIINEIFYNLKNTEIDEQISIINAIEDIILPMSLSSDQRIKVLSSLFSDLNDTSKELFKTLLKSKSFWGEFLVKTIESENLEEACEIFYGNTRSPIQYYTIKSSNKAASPGYLTIFKIPEARGYIKELCSETTYALKYSAYQSLKSLIDPNTYLMDAFIHLKCRCFNVLVCTDQIEYLLDKLPLLSIVGQSYSNLILAFIPSILNALKETQDKKSIFLMVSQLDLKSFHEYTSLENSVLDVFRNGNEEETKAASLATKNMNPEFVEKLFIKTIDGLFVGNERVLVHLIAIKNIIKNWPKVPNNLSEEILKSLMDLINSTKTEFNTKCETIRVLHSLVKFSGISPEFILKYLRNLCFYLEKYYKKQNLDILEIFSHTENIDFRIRCLKSILSILRKTEYKVLIDYKTLCCLGQGALSSILQPSLGSMLIKNIYEKSSLLPPLLSVLSLMALQSDSKGYKEALVQVLKRMKQNSEDQADPELKLKLQPESYTPYIFYIISKCNLTPRTCQTVLSNYLNCLFKSSPNININYLMTLCKQLKKFSPAGKIVFTEVTKLNEAGLDIEKICDEFSLLIVENYMPKDYIETSSKVLIPSAYFVKNKDNKNATPVHLQRKIDGTPARRVLTDTSPKSKQFKM